MADNQSGLWIDSRYWDIFHERKISLTELVLMALIESLSSGGNKCFASNQYLAGKMMIKTRRLQYILTHLKELDLVVSEGKGKNRILTPNHALQCTPKTPQPCTPVHPNHALQCTPPLLCIRTKNRYMSDRYKMELSEMGFIDLPSKKNCHQSDIENSMILLDAIKRKKGIARRYSLKRWNEEFRLLRESDEVDAIRIRDTLVWYCENMDDEYTPKAYSPATFRNKFLQIEDAMSRNVIPVVELSKVGKSILTQLEGKHWPKGSEEQLPYAIQASVDNFQKFVKQTKPESIKQTEVYQKMTKHSRQLLLEFAKHLRSQFGADPDHFVTNWMMIGRDDVLTWDGWSGNLKPFVFSVSHRRFQRDCKSICNSYSGSTKRWDVLMEIIGDLK